VRASQRELSSKICRASTHSTLSLGVRRHLIDNDLQQILVWPLRHGEILARALLKLSVKNVRALAEDGDQLLLDLGEEVEPLEVGGEEERFSRSGTEVEARV